MKTILVVIFLVANGPNRVERVAVFNEGRVCELAATSMNTATSDDGSFWFACR